MGKTMMQSAWSVYEELLTIGVGKKVRINVLRDIIAIKVGGARVTQNRYLRFLGHFKFIKPAGIDKFEILKKERPED